MFVKYDDKSVRLIGRWSRQKDRAVTTACGAKIEFAFYGKNAVLHFDKEYCCRPCPHIWIQLDEGGRIEATVEKYMRICSKEEGLHHVVIIFKSAVEMQHRWYEPLVAHLTFLGYEAENSGGLEQRVERYIEFIGDSITEGILIDEEYRLNNNYEQNNRPFQDDVTATYAYLTAENLKLEPLIMGYGGVGLTKGGSGSVPKAVDAYPFCYNEHYTDMPHPVYVVINYGANDRSVGVEQYLNEYERLLDEVYEHHNETQVIVLSAFCGWCYKELKGFVDNYNLKRERHAQYINTYGWISPTPLHPNREGHIKIANKLTEEMKRRNLT